MCVSQQHMFRTFVGTLLSELYCLNIVIAGSCQARIRPTSSTVCDVAHDFALPANTGLLHWCILAIKISGIFSPWLLFYTTS